MCEYPSDLCFTFPFLEVSWLGCRCWVNLGELCMRGLLAMSDIARGGGGRVSVILWTGQGCRHIIKLVLDLHKRTHGHYWCITASPLALSGRESAPGVSTALWSSPSWRCSSLSSCASSLSPLRRPILRIHLHASLEAVSFTFPAADTFKAS